MVIPDLSVVVVVGPLRGRAAPCLASLEAHGLLFGPGDAEARFTVYELSEPREAPRSASA